LTEVEWTKVEEEIPVDEGCVYGEVVNLFFRIVVVIRRIGRVGGCFRWDEFERGIVKTVG
jgi:hypothetical protein